MNKIIKTLAVNFAILLFLLVCTEIITYFVCLKHFKSSMAAIFKAPKFQYVLHPYINQADIVNFFDGTDNRTRGRLPDGLQYDGVPIVIFGCSFAHGWGLNPNQTFSYKLADILKRPVYNRAVPGQSVQEMYYQSDKNIFYDTIKKSDTVIYVLYEDHYRRMYTKALNVLYPEVLLHYDIKNNDLIYENYLNPLKNLFNSLYTVKVLREKYTKYFINNPQNADKITNDTMLYFIKTRDNLENRWGDKVKFYVLFYGDILYSEKLKAKLRENNFIPWETKELTSENLFSSKYNSKEISHPTEAAWDLLTPFVAERILEGEEGK